MQAKMHACTDTYARSWAHDQKRRMNEQKLCILYRRLWLRSACEQRLLCTFWCCQNQLLCTVVPGSTLRMLVSLSLSAVIKLHLHHSCDVSGIRHIVCVVRCCQKTGYMCISGCFFLVAVRSCQNSHAWSEHVMIRTRSKSWWSPLNYLKFASQQGYDSCSYCDMRKWATQAACYFCLRLLSFLEWECLYLY